MTMRSRPMRAQVWVDWCERIESPFSSGGMFSPEGIIVHWTATPGPESQHARIRLWLEGERARSSTHFVIMRNGHIYQGVPIGRKAWHAGTSRLVLGDGRALARCNEHCIGVDFENVGPLKHKGRGRWVDSYGVAYDGPRPQQQHEPYTNAQIESATKLFSELGLLFPRLQDDVEHRVVGHCDVSPGRKIDPGPLCPWDVLRAAVRHEIP